MRTRRLVAAALLTSTIVGGCLPETVGPGPSGSSLPTPTPLPSPTGPTPPPSFVPPTPTPMPTFFAYVVVRGDTLLSIARSYETTGRSIAFWNRAQYPSLDPESESYSPNRIEIGWTLLLIPGAVVDEQSLPGSTPRPASPRPSPTTGPGATGVPEPLPGAGAVVVSHGRRESNEVALTFDMGGRLDPATDILAWLTAEGVPATIFPTGSAVQDTAIGRLVTSRALARPDLFDVGNHSWDHPEFTDLDAAGIADQLRRTEAAVAALGGGATTKPWFRPPFGAWDEDVRIAVGDAGWGSLVMWDIDTIDWRPTSDGGPTALEIEAKVLSRVQGGSIVLMHLGGYNTRAALPAIVDGLRAKGLEPVTLTELLD